MTFHYYHIFLHVGWGIPTVANQLPNVTLHQIMWNTTTNSWLQCSDTILPESGRQTQLINMVFPEHGREESDRFAC